MGSEINLVNHDRTDKCQNREVPKTHDLVRVTPGRQPVPIKQLLLIAPAPGNHYPSSRFCGFAYSGCLV